MPIRQFQKGPLKNVEYINSIKWLGFINLNSKLRKTLKGKCMHTYFMQSSMQQ